jgi:hypothetical protein
MSEESSIPDLGARLNAGLDEYLKSVQEFGVKPEHPEGRMLENVGLVQKILGRMLVALDRRLSVFSQMPWDKIGQQIDDTLKNRARASFDRAANAFVWRQHLRTTAVIGGAITVALIAGAAVGFLAGRPVGWSEAAAEAADLRPAFQDGVAGAQWLASLVLRNDTAQLAAQCRANPHQAGDGTPYCSINLWTGRRGNP